MRTLGPSSGIFFTVLLLLPSALISQTWYEGEGSVLLVNLTPEEARSEALKHARLEAMEQAQLEIVGTTIRLIRDGDGGEKYDSFLKFVRTVARGRILEEEILFSDLEKQPSPEGTEPVYRYRVTLRAKVQPEETEPDPSFRLELSLNRTVFQEGETLELQMTSTHDCYLTLFNLYSSDSLRVLFPNEVSPFSFLAAGEVMKIPPEGSGWDLPLFLAPGVRKDREAVLAVATKVKVPFDAPGPGVEGRLVSAGDALPEINRWLIDIPADQRVQAMEFYMIVR